MIKRETDLLRRLLVDQNGFFLLAGNSKNMPQAVRDAVKEAIGRDDTYMDEMIKSGRYQEETWA